MRTEDVRPLGIFNGMTDDQLEELIEAGVEVLVEPGMELFREGEHADSWWLLVDGAIDLFRRVGREDTLVARMDVPGRWAGGFRAWDEHGVYLATGRGSASGRVLQVPADVLRERFDAWFPFAGHLIRGVYHTARSIESTARQREALVTLGTLAAGLAHEINNPASAAIRAVDALDESSGTMLDSLRRLAEGELSAEQFADLDELRRQIRPPEIELGALAGSDREQALSDWLNDHGVEREWTIAPLLAAAGVEVSWCDQVAAVISGPALEPALAWVASTLSVGTLLGELRDSTRRISDLVGAVKSYSQMDRASMQRTNVAEGLESTLVMLGHKMRDGVEVVREYGAAVPPIDAYPGELNQVWTNLIDNALDAMESGGTLRITTRLDGDHVVVDIGDKGPGLSPEVAARAFEAFYTTKEVGKGTGLGLDIARRIVVERHGGTITISSVPGDTVLEVRLPVRPAQALRPG